jgi:trimeric autotransporter adhesin
MKPKQLPAIAAIVAFTICIFQKTNGQNVAPFWSLAGNSNASATSKLGTTTWMPLRFFTNNLERMRVNNGGNVGIGTTAPAQKLHVAGNININAGFGLYLNNQKFLSTPGTENLYLGFQAGESSGGFQNLFIGNHAGQNGGGSHNTIIGFEAGMNNLGANNSFCGYQSGKANTSGTYNTFFGLFTGPNNTTGDGNSFFGQNVLSSNVSGSWNCSFGFESGVLNTTGSHNCYYGISTGRLTTESSNNTFIGTNAGDFFDNGSNNTFIGSTTAAASGGLSNSTALGFNASVTASNQVRIGNSAVTSIGGFQAWTNLSDGRFKKNIKENVPGLEFISQLRPITYTIDMDALDKSMNPLVSVKSLKGPAPKKDAAANTDISKIIHTGFVAQEVEEIAKKLDFEFSGIDAPKNDKDFYGLRYSEFVVPLVKAVQELLQKNNDLEERVKELERLLTDKKLPVIGFLDQNSPNPFSGTTIIRYSLPDNAFSAKVVLTNVNGQLVKSINLGNGTTGQVEITKGTLAAGSYYYSLWVDGKKIDTRKMILAK